MLVVGEFLKVPKSSRVGMARRSEIISEKLRDKFQHSLLTLSETRFVLMSWFGGLKLLQMMKLCPLWARFCECEIIGFETNKTVNYHFS